MIFVFKTSVETIENAQAIEPHFDQLLPNIKWNFDLDDCDNILRIESDIEIVNIVMQLFDTLGFYCEELI